MKPQVVSRFARSTILVGLAAIAPSICSALDFVDNFDTDPLGSPPSGWITAGQTTGTVVNSQFVSPSNSVSLLTPADFNSGSTYMFRTNLVNTPTGPFAYFSNDYIYVSLRMTSTNQFMYIGVIDTGQTAAFELHFVQGSIQAYNGATLMTLGSYTSDTWYRVEMMTQPSTIKYSVHVYDPANTTVASATGFDYHVLTAPQGLKFVQFGTIGGSPVSTTAFIDNIFVGVPEPSSVALLALGGLSVVGLRRRT